VDPGSEQVASHFSALPAGENVSFSMQGAKPGAVQRLNLLSHKAVGGENCLRAVINS
jgi:hypothetical protein